MTDSDQSSKICELIDLLNKRFLEKACEKGVSFWLTALPIKHMWYTFGKQEFGDVICLMYNCHINEKCHMKYLVLWMWKVHILTCKKGG